MPRYTSKLFYDGTDISQWVHEYSLECAINQWDATDFASTGTEYGSGIPKWRLPLGGGWEPEFDTLTMPHVGASYDSAAVSVEIYAAGGDRQVAYSWDVGVIQRAEISGEIGQAITWEYVLLLSNTPELVTGPADAWSFQMTTSSESNFDPSVVNALSTCHWDMGDGNEFDTNSVNHDYGFAGIKTVECTADNDTDITSLSCQIDNVVSLDLSKLSALVTLTSFNHEMTTLDLSVNTALVTVNVRNSPFVGNTMTSLNVSNLALMVTLTCYGHLLTTLDISDCVALVALQCQDNSLGQAAVDTVLDDLVTNNKNNGTCNLTDNAIPSAAGLADKATLEGRGWTVLVDS